MKKIKSFFKFLYTIRFFYIFTNLLFVLSLIIIYLSPGLDLDSNSALYWLAFIYNLIFSFAICGLDKEEHPHFYKTLLLCIIFNSTAFMLIFQGSSSYYKFLLISFNIVTLVIMYMFACDGYYSNFISYTIRRRLKYFLIIFLVFILMNIATSVVLWINTREKEWWKFLLYLGSDLSSIIKIIEEKNTNLIIIVVLVILINSFSFFVSGLIFVQSLIFTFKNRKIILLNKNAVNINKNKNIKIKKSILFYSSNIDKFRRELWFKFSNYNIQIKEEQIDSKYIFINSNDNIEDFLNNIKESLGDEKYDKYISRDKDRNNIIIIKKRWNNKLLWKSLWFKLESLNFYDNFQQLYEIEILDEFVVKNIEELTKKYSINSYIRINDNKIHFFSLMDKKNIILENFDKNRFMNTYYLKFITDKNIDEKDQFKNSLQELLTEKNLNLKHLSFQNKKTLISISDKNDIFNDKSEEIIKLLLEIKINDKSFLKKNNEKNSFIEYEMNSDNEIEQILIEIENKFFNSIKKEKKFIPKWINDFNKKEKNNSKKNNILVNDNSFHKLIIKTNVEAKLDQQLKEKIYELIGEDNILNFKETIYLSKYFWIFSEERHSFQFLIKNDIINEEILKKLNYLIRKYKSYQNKFESLYEKEKTNDLEYEIISINMSENLKCVFTKR